MQEVVGWEWQGCNFEELFVDHSLVAAWLVGDVLEDAVDFTIEGLGLGEGATCLEEWEVVVLQ
jgi:hypothetical protein